MQSSFKLDRKLSLSSPVIQNLTSLVQSPYSPMTPQSASYSIVPPSPFRPSEEDLKSIIRNLFGVLSKGNRGRECMDALRQFCQILCMQTLPMEGLPSQLINLLYYFLSLRRSHNFERGNVILEQDTPIKVKVLIAFLIHQVADSEFDLIKTNFRQKYDIKTTSVVLPLLLSFGNESTLEINLPNIVQWIVLQTADYRSSTIPGLLLVAREHKHLLKYGTHVKLAENQFGEWLSRASTVSEQKQTTGTFSFATPFLKTTPEPVTELDGTIAREFFTILNNAQPYTDDQSFNIYSFSALHSWLHSLYIRKKTSAATSTSNGTSAEDSAGSNNDVNAIPNSINPIFQENIVSYCLRVIEQSKLKPVQTNPNVKNAAFDEALPEIALVEAIRILDLICSVDSTMVPKLFPTIKKIFNNRNAAKSNGSVFIALLQFFINHSEVVVYDPEPVFRAFFGEYLSKNFSNPLVAFETLTFCNNNKKKLLNNTNIFSTYFPPLLKLLAWFPHTFIDEFNSLLPALISPTTFSELFHSLLDLPLLVSALEKVEAEKVDLDPEEEEPQESKEYRVLYNHLLRNESGASINFWETVPALLQRFCKETVINPRILEVAKITPYLLNNYFDVMIAYADEKSVQELVPIVIQRIHQLFPIDSFQSEVRKVMETKILAIFHKYPSFVISLKELITQVLAEDCSGAREELVLNLCWIIGEYTSSTLVKLVPEVLNDYHEALELFAYERLSWVKSGEQMAASSSQIFGASTTTGSSGVPFACLGSSNGLSGLLTPNPVFTTRLMNVVMSSLCKLASRWQPLASRVVLCLAKILKHAQYFDNAVIQRANECLAILKYPSIATSILDSPYKPGQRSSHVDTNSSLPFMLESTAPYYPGQRLHNFLPN